MEVSPRGYGFLMRDGPEAPRASRDIVSFVLCDSLADVKQPMQFLPRNGMHTLVVTSNPGEFEADSGT